MKLIPLSRGYAVLNGSAVELFRNFEDPKTGAKITHNFQLSVTETQEISKEIDLERARRKAESELNDDRDDDLPF